MTTLQRRAARGIGAWSALLVAICVLVLGLGAGVAGAAETTGPSAGAIDLGANEPTTTIVVDGTPIELIPAASAELPPEATDGATESGIEVQGVSAQAGSTAPAGAGSSMATIWIVIAAVVVLGAAVLLAVRRRRATSH